MIMPKKPLSLMNCHTSGDAPLIQHFAQLLDRSRKKILFFFAQSRLWECQQLVPVRLAAEQISVPPYRSGIERLQLGLRKLGQLAAENLQ
jgi:hypothetical protein